MLCIYDMVEARQEESEISDVQPLDIQEVLRRKPVPDPLLPRLQIRDSRTTAKVILPPCGLPH